MSEMLPTELTSASLGVWGVPLLQGPTICQGTLPLSKYLKSFDKPVPQLPLLVARGS